jgi:DnaK suppressor protein
MLTNGQTGLFDKISQYEAAGDYRVADLAEDIEVNVVQRELTMLDEIMAARKRIKDGTYGICAECGEPVSERRLAVFPEALRCHSCQSITEVISDKLTRGNVGANRYL